MNVFSSVNWSGFVGPLTTFVAAFLAYLLGQRTYRRQKEYELVRSRYLDGGVDRFAANVEYALAWISTAGNSPNTARRQYILS